MGTFVTSDGFIKKSYEDHKAYYEGIFQEIFGESIDLDPTGPIGQMIAQFAIRDANLWDGAEEIYNSRNPNNATGISLDNICAETGVIRQAEGKTFVSNVYLYGDLATTIPAASLARQTGNDVNFELLDEVVISLNTARLVDITCDTPGGAGEDFTIVLDAVTYTHTSLVTDDENDVAEALKVLIEAGAFTGTVSRTDATLTILRPSSDFTITYSVNINLDLIAAGGDFECVVTGPNAVPAETLDTIVTPVTGWDSVSNSATGISGRLTETDSELRIRRSATQLTGNATEEALRAAILNNVDGVSSVAILSNRTDVTDGDGLPPHSFELVIVGGDDSDIGNSIWETQPAGIASYGLESVVVKDSQGNDQTVNFSRSTAKYIWVKVQRDFYDEEVYPDDGDNQIKEAIVEWALENQTVSKDVIRQRLNIPVYSVPGVGNVVLLIDATATPLGTPSYAEQDIDIAIREYAAFDIARIIVEAIP